MALKHWFIPHPQTHKKAHLLSWQGILIYAMIFVFLQSGFSIVSFYKPGILGVSSGVQQKDLIQLTNIERQKKGLSILKENEALNKAAVLKAENMFSENYWAHYAPSGKTPWDFILGSGYRFTYAGENLAKNFYKSDDVIYAWMNSPSHRDNLLSAKYEDIGIAVVEGTLNGQKTTLVVQEFGSTNILSSTPIVNVGGQEKVVPKDQYNNSPAIISANSPVLSGSNFFVDTFAVSKGASLMIIFFMGGLLTVDMLVLYKRGVLSIKSGHTLHFSLLAAGLGGILVVSPGSIL
jgi:hypothetical protein